jgi:arsenite methyltransferase
MPTLQVFDPPMCCSSGVCGPEPDTTLVQFTADLRGLAARGVSVERFNLAQRPEAFVAQPAVRSALETLGVGVLPLIVVDGRIASHGRYPSRAELEAFVAEDSELVFSLDVVPAGGCAPDSSCC